MTSEHAAESIGHDHAADIDRQVKIYITVFVALMALTLVTVAVSYLHLPTPMAIARGVAGGHDQGHAGGVLLHAPHLGEAADLRGAGNHGDHVHGVAGAAGLHAQQRLLDPPMNLRVVHAFLILMSAALAVLFGVWCLGQYGRDNGVGTLIAAIVSFAASFALVAYDSWFLRKTRTLR